MRFLIFHAVALLAGIAGIASAAVAVENRALKPQKKWTEEDFPGCARAIDQDSTLMATNFDLTPGQTPIHWFILNPHHGDILCKNTNVVIKICISPTYDLSPGYVSAVRVEYKGHFQGDIWRPELADISLKEISYHDGGFTIAWTIPIHLPVMTELGFLLYLENPSNDRSLIRSGNFQIYDC